MMLRRVATVIFWLLIGISAMLLWEVVRSANQENGPSGEMSYSQFMSEVDAGKVASVTITGAEIRGRYRDTKGQFHLTGPANEAVYLDHLRDKGVDIRFRESAKGSTVLQLVGTWAPLILLAVLWIFMIRLFQTRVQQAAPRRAGNAPIDPN